MSAVYSMTGFATMSGSVGPDDGAAQPLAFTLTLKSVNHRFLDLSLRLPHNCDLLEAPIRRMVKDVVHRGHVDLTLQLVRGEASTQIQLNHDLLAAHVEAFRQAAKRYDSAAELDLNALLRHPGVLRAETAAVVEDVALLQGSVLTLVPEVLARLNEVRAQEGASLVEELCAAMMRLKALVATVSTLREDVRATYVERIRTRMAELLKGMSIGEDRLLAEAALLAERSDIDEELVRLQTHIARFLTLLEDGGELGKRLDFLLQELNREANTLLSKTSGATAGNGIRITELGLEMKLEIEKAREQVQNLE
ncbi:YicC/YloC family endoribonuclease [Granulicella arctica]|uniref:YicC/YloC family endoribonuclease n=1 Tax=Granulicella arctica TaxID=940613 RepID=UPI0021E0742C|nr:YicC/YloC family endoribonuclease [Granulicella arctica]